MCGDPLRTKTHQVWALNQGARRTTTSCKLDDGNDKTYSFKLEILGNKTVNFKMDIILGTWWDEPAYPPRNLGVQLC